MEPCIIKFAQLQTYKYKNYFRKVSFHFTVFCDGECTCKKKKKQRQKN